MIPFLRVLLYLINNRRKLFAFLNLLIFFGIKGLKEDNVETKAKISIINNELFIWKRFVNNSEFKYGEKTEKICREFVDMLRLKINYDLLSDGEVTST